MVTVAMTGCDPAANWQSIGLYYSFVRSGQPGRFVRIAACREDEALQDGPSKLVPTWVTEGVSQVGNIVYPLFNKAWAIKQFMELASPAEEYVLVLDSDMLIYKPFLPTDFNLVKSVAASENIWYLEDLNSFLVHDLLPDLPAQSDWDAYPGAGRVADQVGEFYFLHRDDMANVAPLWWEYTLPVLNAIQRSGRIVQSKQSMHRRVWYAEMHAYALGAAKEGVHHLASNSSIFHMGYYHPHGEPNALHYAWKAKVPGFDWAFDKHQYKEFVAEKCPPWDLGNGEEGLFPHPPSPSQLTSKGGELIRNLLNIEVVATLNMAFCDLHHNKLCAAHEQSQKECSRAASLIAELKEAWDQVEANGGRTCIDVLPEGECGNTDRCTENMMHFRMRQDFCRKTCGMC
ncbi:g3662 [Coccomyxa elongata]